MTKRVLFFAPFGMFQVHHQVDLMIGTALRFRGCDVHALLCDGLFPACDVLAWSKENAAQDCAACHYKGESLFAALDFPRTFLKALVGPDDKNAAAEKVDALLPHEYSDATIDNLEFGKWVTSSIFSYFRIGFDSLHLPHVQRVHRQFLINGILTWKALERFCAEFNPTHLFIFNGRFAPYRVALEFGRKNNIPVITHERGYIDDAFFLFRDHSCIESKPFFECIDAWRSIPLSADALAMVKQNFLDREHGKGSNYTPFITYTTDVASVKSQLGIPQDAKIVSVFTSSEYELAYCDDFKTEISQVEALQRLCEVFKDRPEYLVIRHHPYIGGVGESPPDVRLLAQIHQMAKNLPSNVRVIVPSEKLSSYALFSVSDASISFLSTAGIEAIVRGVPTASLPQSYYRDSMTEIMNDVSVTGLKTIIDSLLARHGLVSAENLTRAYRTYHSIIGRLSQRFKSFGIKDIFEPDIRIQSVEDFHPGTDEALDRVCAHIMSNNSLIPLPSEQDKTLYASDELAFIQAELDGLKAKKNEILKRCSAIQYVSPPAVLHISLSTNKEEIGTIEQSRMKMYSTQQIHVSGSFSDSLDSLIEILQASKTPYVYISHNSVRTGEAAIPVLVGSLEGNQSYIAGRVGGWIVDTTETPLAGVFSTRDPVHSLDSLDGPRSILMDPTKLISFFLFRREALIPLLEQWKEGGFDLEISAQLIELTSDSALFASPLQNILVPISS